MEPVTPNKSFGRASTGVNSYPLSPFSYSEDSLKIRPADVEANNLRVPLNLPLTPHNHQTLSRRTSLPCSPLSRKLSSPSVPSYPSFPSYPASQGLSPSYSGGSVGSPARTMRDYNESLREMNKENFNLKLRIFFLEERLALGKESSREKLLASNIDLKVQLEACRQELSEKLSLLVEAGEALEVLDEKLKNNDKETRTDCKILKTKPKKLEALGLENKNLSDEESGEECLTSEKLLLEVLEDIEEFDKKEKCFEEKYNKRIKELKESSEKTEYDLKKIQEKVSGYEDELEALNANLDAKSEFIVALQKNLEEKNDEAKYYLIQLQKSDELIKVQEKEINSIRKAQTSMIKKKSRPRKCAKSVGVGTDSNNFIELIKLLEDEILFKNQELCEFQAELRLRDATITQLKDKINSLNRIQNPKTNSLPREDEVEKLERTNKKLEEQIKLQNQERKMLLKKINMLKQNDNSHVSQLRNKEASTQCDLQQSSVIYAAYKENLAKIRHDMGALRKRLAHAVHSLQEFKERHDKFVHIVEVIVSMDDINIEDAVNNLVNDTRWQFVLENEHQDEINLFGSMSDSCSSSDQSSEPSWNVDADLAEFNEKSQEESTLKMLLNTAELLKQHSLESNPERPGPNPRENRDRLRNKNTETHKHFDCPHNELLNNASVCKPQHSAHSKEKFSRKSTPNSNRERAW